LYWLKDSDFKVAVSLPARGIAPLDVGMPD
jgi:hypothetical protein